MQTIWIHRNHQKECLLFFAGWGMDATPFVSLQQDRFDLCMVCDYRQLNSITLEQFGEYDRLHLVAWSMGVWVASHLLAGLAGAFASRTAIGGTLHPIDKDNGIPPQIYDALISTFSEQTLLSFYRNMFDQEQQLTCFLNNRPGRTLEALLEEMVAFRDAYLLHGQGQDIFSNKIITSRDRIFAGRNQARSWGKGQGTVVPWPHFPFYSLAGWQELIVQTHL